MFYSVLLKTFTNFIDHILFGFYSLRKFAVKYEKDIFIRFIIDIHAHVY